MADAPTDARTEVLARVRAALAGSAEPAPLRRAYRQAGDVVHADLLGLLTERLIDYRATVLRCTPPDLPARLAGQLLVRGITDVAVPGGFPAAWLELLPAHRQHREPLTVPELDVLDGTLSTCTVAVAETGTLVLDAGPGQGRRALSLVPDYLLVVVRAEQVVAAVPDAVHSLDPRTPMTWISGPSATSDIELQRVEGVHGPRTLDVIILDGDDPWPVPPSSC